MNPVSKKISGMTMAVAAATLFVSGCASQGSSADSMADSSAVKVKCYGANACKGNAECKTAMNACKGQNECKGQGFVGMTDAECIDRLGRT